MKVYTGANIRNVALVGHSGSGKTQLASAMLFNAGSITRLGLVDDGTTVTDFDEEEIERKHTLASSLAFAEWDKVKINLIDTPGIANFMSDTRAAMRVADAAVLVVDAVAGVEVQTEKVWSIAEELNLPLVVVLNRLDRERASLDRSLNSLHDVCGREIVPIQLPIGEEQSFTGVVDLVSMKAMSFSADGNGKPSDSEIPENMADVVNSARESLIEMVAEADDALMERFFEAGTLTQAELEQGLRTAVVNRRIFPLVCSSAVTNIAVHSVLDAIRAYVPSPDEHPLPAVGPESGEPVTYDVGDDAPATAFVWKTIADPFAGRINLFRVASGTLASDTSIYNINRETAERLGSLAVLQGKTQTTVDEIKCGDLGAIAKLKETQTADTLAPKGSLHSFAAIKFAEPVLSYAIEPKNRGDEEKIGGSVHRLEEEDPTIRYARDPQTGQLLLSGQGQLHIEVTVAKLKRRFGVEVNLDIPSRCLCLK